MGARPLLVFDKQIIFFDANCLLCSRFIKILLRYDREKMFFSSFDSAIANELLLQDHITDPTTIVYAFQGNLLYKSNAIFAIVKQMKWPWHFLYLFKILPKRWNDSIYDFIAKNRIKWFGRTDNCYLPTPHQRDRFFE